MSVTERLHNLTRREAKPEVTELEPNEERPPYLRAAEAVDAVATPAFIDQAPFSAPDAAAVKRMEKLQREAQARGQVITDIMPFIRNPEGKTMAEIAANIRRVMQDFNDLFDLNKLHEAVEGPNRHRIGAAYHDVYTMSLKLATRYEQYFMTDEEATRLPGTEKEPNKTEELEGEPVSVVADGTEKENKA